MATVVTNVGFGIITNRIKGAGGAEPNYVAWGTDGTAAAATDTALGAESAEARVAGTSSQETTTVPNDTYQVVGTITSAGTQTIQEAGLFDAATVGNMFVSSQFTGIPLVVDESIQFTFKAQFT